MPRQRSILYSALILMVAVALLHFLSGEHSLYWRFWWYDVMMHFLAGVAGGLASYWVLFSSGHFFKTPQKLIVMILVVLLCVFIAGVAWEVFEYVNGFTDSHEGYQLDVTNDLVLDTAGAVLASLIASRRKRNG